MSSKLLCFLVSWSPGVLPSGACDLPRRQLRHLRHQEARCSFMGVAHGSMGLIPVFFNLGRQRRAM